MPYEIWNRRYTGSKYKLADWIVDLICENCRGDSFCDLFAGTAILTQRMLCHVSRIHINDLLYSNELIYKAFFLNQPCDMNKLSSYIDRYASLDPDQLPENYMSEHFGNNFFSMRDARWIGHIREQIDSDAAYLTEKERAVLIASLLYSADKAANTVGHYDAYIQSHTIPDRFALDIISPYDTHDKRVSITRQDANQLAKHLACDIVYIDPPYNSRQYSRFYHVLENIACWKKPDLYGVAHKPAPENMSEYCRSAATRVFSDLIANLQCRYIVVSYNNTYASKSTSSRNKIALESLRDILQSRGELMTFSREHAFFNAGKTSFNDHKEYIFIVKVGE